MRAEAAITRIIHIWLKAPPLLQAYGKRYAATLRLMSSDQNLHQAGSTQTPPTQTQPWGPVLAPPEPAEAEQLQAEQAEPAL